METVRGAMRQIVVAKRLRLGSSFRQIESKAKANCRYEALLENKVWRFDPEKNELVYLTERIYPSRTAHPERIPVLFLFSNPHPDSVARGLFLSELYSRAFWQRLLEVNEDYLRFPCGAINPSRWADSINGLVQTLLNGGYESPFLLYFHCLYPIPTRKPEDLKALFGLAPDIWEQIKMSSRRELVRLIRQEQLKHVVVFSVRVFRAITNTGVRGWATKKAIEEFFQEGGEGRCQEVDSNGVRIYLTLHTRAKNWKDDRGQYYFTRFLNLIFAAIEQSTLL